MICAIDTETTGLTIDCGIVEIAIVPLLANFEPDPNITPFHLYVNPGTHHLQDLPLPCKAMLINGLSRDKLAQEGIHYSLLAGRILGWMMANQIDKIDPLAQNWAFDAKMLELNLGSDNMAAIFSRHIRDAKRLAIALEDRAHLDDPDAAPLFKSHSLQNLAKQFEIDPGQAHTATADAITCAKVYRHLLTYMEDPKCQPSS